jgi:hypothetical protein
VWFFELVFLFSCLTRRQQSAIDTDKITIESDTMAMLKSMDFGNLANIEVKELSHFQYQERRPFGERKQAAQA